MGKTEKKMEIVIDTNKIISAILKSGKIRKLLLRFKFYVPKALIEELEKHKKEICKKARITSDVFDFIFGEIVLPRVLLIPDEKYKEKIDDALNIVKNFDEDDTPFIALALKLNMPIWTNDKNF